MENFNVYNDISARTNGDIYIGVVGPVRTGKSTFIKRLMELLVLPEIKDVHSKERTKDELPQSASGKTIMTTEPKFIPKEAVTIEVAEGLDVSVRMIDCVGYMVDGAVGHEENEQERLVKTPWFDYEIPFTQAAELGTKKVITDHSTIGVVVTTDGTIGEIPRESYAVAEEKTVDELKKLGKPFIILLNCIKPYSEESVQLAKELKEKYGVNVRPVNCEQLKKEDVNRIMEDVLQEFPVTQVDFHIPKWIEILPTTHWMKEKMVEMSKNILANITYMKDIKQRYTIADNPYVKQVLVEKKNLSNGVVSLEIQVDHTYYYQIISDYVGLSITGEYQLMKTLLELAKQKNEYEKIQSAMETVKYKGYGVVTPSREEIELDEPKIIRHGGKYGVKMKAIAPSIHLIKSYIETEIAPIVGSEQQADDLIAYIKDTARTSNEGIWDTNIFGKSIEQIVDDGISTKISQMTDDCQLKLQETLQKVMNDSNGGMICIII